MLQNQTLSAIISSLRAFDLFSDTLDILIISFVFYQLIQFARKSRAGQLVKGIALLILFYGFAVLLDLRTVTWVLNNVVTVAFTAAVVIFQPELRRALERMARPPYGRTGCSATAAPILRCAVCGRALWLPSAMRLNSFPTPAPVP